MIICWDITDDPHSKKWKGECESVSKINPDSGVYYGVTHKIKLLRLNRPTDVISLKHLIEWINNSRKKIDEDKKMFEIKENKDVKDEKPDEEIDFDDFFDDCFSL